MSQLITRQVKVGRPSLDKHIKRQWVSMRIGAQTQRDLLAYVAQHRTINPKANIGRTLDHLVRHLVETKYSIR